MNVELRKVGREKRRERRFRQRILSARDRWETLVEIHAFDSRKVIGDSRRSPKKVLYFIEPGEWWDEVRAEMRALAVAKSKYPDQEVRSSRGVWLPTVIEQAVKITLKTYTARSVREVPRKMAESYASQTANRNARLLQQNKIDPCTGINYRMRVSDLQGIRYVSFTEWAVCICKGKVLPTLKKSHRPPDTAPQNEVSDAPE
jgi:hypothetical protein